MEYRKLGRSGLSVSAIGLGCNNFGWRLDEERTAAVVNRALELGINFLDTSDSYGRGLSETYIGNILKGRRREAILATKFASPMGDRPNDRGGSRYHIMEAVDASLRRLQTDYIDLYQMHVVDPATPIEETLRTLDDLVHAGKVRYIGCSNFAAWQLCEAIWTSRSNNRESFISVQPLYNAIDRRIERELIPCCVAYGIGIIPYSPLANGFLTGKYRRGQAAMEGTRLAGIPAMQDRIFTEENFAKLDKLEVFATTREHSVGDLAIAWLLAQPMISTVIAGATSPEQVGANIKGADWKLEARDLEQLEL
ncbi:MAG: aldo/keto reductase [Chloroflexi bacterium]|nr:aldo/keto reductase [Chloroflexota bacterium]